MDNIRVYEENGAIVIRGAEGKRATVSDMSGIVLHNDVCSDVSVISVNKGVYVVKVNGKAIEGDRSLRCLSCIERSRDRAFGHGSFLIVLYRRAEEREVHAPVTTVLVE